MKSVQSSDDDAPWRCRSALPAAAESKARKWEVVFHYTTNRAGFILNVVNVESTWNWKQWSNTGKTKKSISSNGTWMKAGKGKQTQKEREAKLRQKIKMRPHTGCWKMGAALHESWMIFTVFHRTEFTSPSVCTWSIDNLYKRGLENGCIIWACEVIVSVVPYCYFVLSSIIYF